MIQGISCRKKIDALVEYASALEPALAYLAIQEDGSYKSSFAAYDRGRIGSSCQGP